MANKKHGKKISQGMRKYLRREKARIRRQFLLIEDQEREIKALKEKFY